MHWFCNVLALVALAATSIVNAQERLPRVGVLSIVPATQRPLAAWVNAAREALAQQGFIEGKTVTYVFRDARGDPENFSSAATELVRQKVDVIYAISAAAIRTAHAQTKSIPVVGTDYTNDPVAVGYAKSYARPGGNVTGVFVDAPEFSAKWLELMREIVPNLTRTAALWDPSPGDTHVRALESVGRTFGLQLQIVQVRRPQDIESAGDAFSNQPQALVVLPSPMFYVETARLAKLTHAQRLPATAMGPEFADAGGLLAYGPNDIWSSGRVGMMVAKILRGAKAGDLPIERPLKFDLVLNLKTAKLLGLKIPQTVIERADRVIR
jgi:putative tryptophan/tyrosine transport system substrate-binding protein